MQTRALSTLAGIVARRRRRCRSIQRRWASGGQSGTQHLRLSPGRAPRRNARARPLSLTRAWFCRRRCTRRCRRHGGGLEVGSDKRGQFDKHNVTKKVRSVGSCASFSTTRLYIVPSSSIHHGCYSRNHPKVGAHHTRVSASTGLVCGTRVQ